MQFGDREKNRLMVRGFLKQNMVMMTLQLRLFVASSFESGNKEKSGDGTKRLRQWGRICVFVSDHEGGDHPRVLLFFWYLMDRAAF